MTAKLIERIQFYKKVLLGLYFLCAISLCTSFTLNGYYFFKRSQDFKNLRAVSLELESSLQDSNSKTALTQANEYAAQVKLLEEKAFTLQAEILVSVIAILMFGLVLPYLIILQIKRKIEDLQKKVEAQVQQWVRGWLLESRKYGSNAQTQPEFWLKIALLTVEQISQYSAHPAVYMASEVARIIRSEMEKPLT